MGSYLADLDFIILKSIELSTVSPLLSLLGLNKEHIAKEELKRRLVLKNDIPSYLDALYQIFLLSREYSAPELIWLANKDEEELFKQIKHKYNDKISTLDKVAICLDIISSKNDSMVKLLVLELAYTIVNFKLVCDALILSDYTSPILAILASRAIDYDETHEILDDISEAVITRDLPCFKIIEILINEGCNGTREYYNELYAIAFKYREMEGYKKLKLTIDFTDIDIELYLPWVLDNQFRDFFDTFNRWAMYKYLEGNGEKLLDVPWVMEYLETKFIEANNR